MNNYEKAKLDASTKAVTEKGTVRIEYPLPLQELIGGFRDDIERYSAEVGLLIIQEVIEAEIASRVGRHGQQSNYRHVLGPSRIVWRATGSTKAA